MCKPYPHLSHPKFAMPAAERTQSTTFEKTTFENLPDSILSHIAAYVTNGTHTDAALRFAHTCAGAREAVLDALSYRIDYIKREQVNVFNNLNAWTHIFAKSSRPITINLVSPDWISCNDYGDRIQVPPQHVRLLSKNACSAIVPYQPKWLAVLSSAPRLRHLHIRTSRLINHQLLFDVLETLSLDTLALSCAPRSSIGCIFNQYALFDAHHGIIQACPTLTELRVECRCGCAVWPMLCSRPIVTPCHMSIECQNGMPTEFTRLASLHQQNLMLIYERRPPRGDKSLTRALSVFLTELCIPLAQKCFHCAADFTCLSVCSKLEKVSIVIGAGTERLLAGVISNWAELRVLELRWDYEYDNFSRVGHLWPQASPGFLVGVAKSAPKLQRIAMKEIKIPIREITAGMKVLGSRLTHIGISNENQAEDPLARYEAILETATVWNPALLEIACYNCHTTELARSAVPKRLLALMLRLERAAPYLSEYPLKQLLHNPGFRFA